MGYCTICGSTVNGSHCSNCGNNARPVMPDAPRPGLTYQPAQVKSKTWLWWAGGGAIVLLLLIVVVGYSAGSNSSANATSGSTGNSNSGDTATADNSVAIASSIDNSDAPYAISECTISLSETTGDGDTQIYHLNAAISYKNVSDKPISAIQTLVLTRDGMGDIVKPFVLDDDDGMDLNASGSGSWTADNVPNVIHKAECYPGRVKYRDGTMWETTNPSLESAVDADSSSGS